jgi:hypothetical protein
MQTTKGQPESAGDVSHNRLLSGLSLITVINLKYSEDEYINVTHSGPANNGKYLGWITKIDGRPVISTEPIFGTSQDAEAHMRSVITAARKWDNPETKAAGCNEHPALTSKKHHIKEEIKA